MKKLIAIRAIALAGAMACCSPAVAATIVGPNLTINDAGFDQTGIQFDALSHSTLTQVTFRSQLNADTITLTNLAGTVLFSSSVAAGSANNVINLNWALVAGNSYRLLQNRADNARYNLFGMPLPFNSDIAITNSSLFHLTGSPANSFFNFGSNTYWVAFNNITTTSIPAVPEPTTWALMIVGFAMIGFARRQRPNVRLNAASS